MSKQSRRHFARTVDGGIGAAAFASGARLRGRPNILTRVLASEVKGGDR